MASVRRYCPGLPLDRAEKAGSGQNNDIWQIGDRLLFRFPKHPEGVEALRKEADLLRRVAGRLPLDVPYPLYTVFEGDEGTRAFMGYAKIEGEPLEPDRLHAGMRERVRFYRGTFAHQEALFGLERGDEDAFRNGLESVNAPRRPRPITETLSRTASATAAARDEYHSSGGRRLRVSGDPRAPGNVNRLPRSRLFSGEFDRAAFARVAVRQHVP